MRASRLRSADRLSMRDVGGATIEFPLVTGTARRARGCGGYRAPSGHRSPAASPCRSRAPRASQWRTRSSAPPRWRRPGRIPGKAAIDALHHVDVVAHGAARAVIAARAGLDGDRLRGADRLAELAGDASLLAVRVAAQRVLAAEARADGALLERVIDGRLGLEEIASAPATWRRRTPSGEAHRQPGRY